MGLLLVTTTTAVGGYIGYMIEIKEQKTQSIIMGAGIGALVGVVGSILL